MNAPAQLLIIDDNADLVENLVDIFGAREFDVRVARSASAGLSMARDHGYDLAFVDVNLPDSSGLELLPELRRAVPLGEVVLMTGHATIDSAIRAVRGGAFHYVVKPFKADDLIATAESALRQVALRGERAQLAHQLEASEQRYRDVVESAQLLVVAVDDRGIVRMANRRTAELTGWSTSELESGRTPFVTLFPPEIRDVVIERMNTAGTGSDSSEFEAPLVAHDGRVRTVRWHATSAGTDDAELNVYIVGADVTERLALQRRAAEAEALAQMGALAAGLAHEIRNPLNAAGLQLHLLGRNIERLASDERAPLRGRVEIVAAELKRLERLLSDFLELARPRPIAREPVDMARLLDEVLALHEPSATERGIQIKRAIDACSAVGDRERLKQVFHNLIVNAMEATSEGGTITVDAHRDAAEPPTLLVTVSDNGRGIPTATLERVFEPFFTTKEAGTGLGLAIVRQIVQRHGGGVQLESQEGKGSRVSIRLPATSVAAKPRAARTAG